MVKYKLKPKCSRVKSFYNKAWIMVYPDRTELVSYNTVVLIKDETGIKINGWYSATTARHINEFLQQEGFPAINKNLMEDFARLKLVMN